MFYIRQTSFYGQVSSHTHIPNFSHVCFVIHMKSEEVVDHHLLHCAFAIGIFFRSLWYGEDNAYDLNLWSFWSFDIGQPSQRIWSFWKFCLFSISSISLGVLNSNHMQFLSCSHLCIGVCAEDCPYLGHASGGAHIWITWP